MQPTNWKRMILQKFSNKIESSKPQGRLFRLSPGIRRRNPLPWPEHLALRARGAWGQELHRTGENRHWTISIYTRFCVHWDRAVTPEETGLNLLEGLGESPRQVGSVVAHWGARRMVAEDQGLLSRVSSARGHHFDSKTWTYQMAYRLQCQNVTVQTFMRKGTQTNPWADQVPKAILSL